ncbi:Uncharacterized protein SCF082_LOCUS22824, partial [Durusdinium trenchii]
EEIPLAAYQRYRLFLQQVQLRRGSQARRYVLKGQLIHLQYLDELRSVFPDARVIWCHRPAEQVVGSLCSLRKSQQEVFLSVAPDRSEVGRGVLKYLSVALGRAGEVLQQAETTEHLVHVQYESLVADPVAVVEKIYESYGWRVSEEHREAMEMYLAEAVAQRSRSEIGKKRYHDASLSSYGLSGPLVRQAFRRHGHAARFSDLRLAFQGTCGVLRHSELQ